MPAVKEIYKKLCEAFPLALCESWDNSGFLIGRTEKSVNKALISLDVTDAVAGEAYKDGFDLIISHHPVIFRPLNKLTDESTTGDLIQKLIRCDIAVVSMHTNADSAEGGVNDLLAKALGMSDIRPLGGGESRMLGRFGVIPDEMRLSDFLAHVKASLNPFAGARYVDGGRPVKRVAVGGGACGELLFDAFHAGCDTFITSDVKYSSMLYAAALKVNLIDAGHFETENLICGAFAGIVSENFPDLTVKIASDNINPVRFYISEGRC